MKHEGKWCEQVWNTHKESLSAYRKEKWIGLILQFYTFWAIFLLFVFVCWASSYEIEWIAKEENWTSHLIHTALWWIFFKKATQSNFAKLLQSIAWTTIFTSLRKPKKVKCKSIRIYLEPNLAIYFKITASLQSVRMNRKSISSSSA